jgi:hypothetical protein
MGVSGTIERDELTTALRLVSRGRGTGVLTVSADYASACVAFEEGLILSASGTNLPRLGEILVEKGLVSPEKLDAALWVQRQDKQWRALGQVMVDVRLLQLPVVEAAIEEQIARVLDQLLRWNEGTFKFVEQAPARGALIVPPCRDLGQYEVKVAMLRAATGSRHELTVE